MNIVTIKDGLSPSMLPRPRASVGSRALVSGKSVSHAWILADAYRDLIFGTLFSLNSRRYEGKGTDDQASLLSGQIQTVRPFVLTGFEISASLAGAVSGEMLSRIAADVLFLEKKANFHDRPADMGLS